MDKQTSDERLLKIIENSGESRRGAANIPGAKKAFGHPVALKLNLATLKNFFKELKLNLVKINKVLIGVGVLLTLIFVVALFSGPAVSKSNASYFVAADSSSVAKFISAGERQGLTRKSFSSEDLKRNFFLPLSVQGGFSGGASLEELKEYKLVGIIWSAAPEVMIENSSDGRTYIFKKGESFNDQFKIKEISRNSAILEISTGSGTREYELR